MTEQYYAFQRDRFIVTTDRSRFDIHAIQAALTRSTWAPGIDSETVSRSIENSLCFGLFEDEKQIGLARLITDYATFGYLCDVYVLDGYQQMGLGRWLVECVQAHPLLARLRRIMLVTDSAPWLYEKLGYRAVNRPDFVWQINRPEIYLNKE